MERCFIFCAGAFDRLLFPISGNDTVIAADGGLLHTQKLGITPDIILGDFDSLGYQPKNATVFPVEKDDTDAMLAVRKALELGCREIFLYGSLDGRRLDHTVANFQTLQFLTDRGSRGYLVGNDYIATVISRETAAFPAGTQGILSLFCMGPDATGITLSGLKYTMENGSLSAGFPLGVSNHFTGQRATITVENGSVLALWARNNALPSRQRICKKEV